MCREEREGERDRETEGGTKLGMKCVYQSVVRMDKREESLQSISDVSDVQKRSTIMGLS